MTGIINDLQNQGQKLYHAHEFNNRQSKEPKLKLT